MLAAQSAIRSRIDELGLSYTGYGRQLGRADIRGERRERLEVETRLLEEEIATLEKIAQLGRVEPDRDKVEAAVRERLGELRERLANETELSGLAPEQRDQSSGEVRGLLWALGEDSLTQNMRKLVAGHERADPSRTDRALPGILIHTLQEGPSPETRASAAFELGKLKVVQAIPALAAALDDEPLVEEMALRSLCFFSEDELKAGGVAESIVNRVGAARPR